MRNSLPADPVAFTGREAELETILGALGDPGVRGGVVAIQGRVQAVDGMPGVGKTAFALHVAHQVKERFRDRCLFVDLYGHAPNREPATPETVLAGLLTAVGVEPERIPDDLDGRSGLWRDRMAGQRALLVLDNAASSDQVRPLLPGNPESMVLITSRRYLGDLGAGATIIPLDVLPPPQAEAMFLHLARDVEADPQALAQVVEMTGQLPLAISLLAGVCAKHPTWTVAVLIDQIRERLRLLTVKAENKTIAAAFDLSYDSLDEHQQRFFLRLSLHPGTEIDNYAAAALTATTLHETDDLLDTLYGARLLTEPTPCRYGMHDLIRAYLHDRAVRVLPQDEQDQILERLLDYYQVAAHHARGRLTTDTTALQRYGSAWLPQPPPATPALPDPDHAWAWLRAEGANLAACLDHAIRSEQHTRVIHLGAPLAEVLAADGPWPDAAQTQQTIANAARAVGDRAVLAWSYVGLGWLRMLVADYPTAETTLQSGLDIFRDLDDHAGEAAAHSVLGTVLRLRGCYPEAHAHQERARALYQEAHDPGEGRVLYELGTLQMYAGNYPLATSHLQAAAYLGQEADDPAAPALPLFMLAHVHRRTGDYAEAHRLLTEAMSLAPDSRIIQDEGRLELAALARLEGDIPAAVALANEALERVRDVGDPGTEAMALRELGRLSQIGDDLQDARNKYEESLELARRIDQPWQEAETLTELGRCARDAGDLPKARTQLVQALEVFQRLHRAEADQVAAELDALNGPGSDAPGVAERTDPLR